MNTRGKRELEYFTIVFRGDITKLPFNPMKAQTVFGEVVASGMGHAFDDVEDDVEAGGVLEKIGDLIDKWRRVG